MVSEVLAQIETIQNTGEGLDAAGKAIPVLGCVSVNGSGSPVVDSEWQMVSDSVADHLLAAAALMVRAGADAVSAAAALQTADQHAAVAR